MCLSPEVDLAAAVVVGAVAVDTLRRNHNPDARMLAAIPAIFAVHNVASALMWWQLRGQVTPRLGAAATVLYELVAFGLWPVYVPLAVRAMERVTWRRRTLAALWVGGVMIAAVQIVHIARGQMTAVEHHLYVAFEYPGIPWAVGALYGIATCGALFLSSHRELVWWAGVNAVAILWLDRWSASGLPSLWCLWAAVTSLFLNWFIRGHRFRRGVPHLHDTGY